MYLTVHFNIFNHTSSCYEDVNTVSLKSAKVGRKMLQFTIQDTKLHIIFGKPQTL